MVDESGQCIDEIRLEHIRGNLRDAPAGTDPRRGDIDLLTDCLTENRPDLVVLGVNGMQCRYFYKDLAGYVRAAESAKPGFRAHLTMGSLEACTFASKDDKTLDFKAKPEVSQCVMLARKMQNPIAALARLYNDAADYKCLKLHPLQDEIDPVTLRRSVERAFLRAVGFTGVNLTRAIQHPHFRPALQFVSGLGPVKALQLLAAAEKAKVESREALSQIVTPVVFRNCSGFIRVEGRTALDVTRVLPEHYTYAYQIAIDALEINPVHENKMNLYIVRAMTEPKKLVDNLDLEAYSDQLEAQGRPRMLQVFQLITREIAAPFADSYRRPYADIEDATLWPILTGEPRENLQVGQIVPVRVTKVLARGVNCVLDSGVRGWIRKEDLSDRHVYDVSDVDIQPDRCLNARVLRVDVNNISVDLSIKTSDLRDASSWEKELPTDMYFENNNARDPDEPPEERAAAQLRRPRRQLARRAINHIQWKNFNKDEAESYLLQDSVPSGTGLFRPASKGPNFIILSFKWGPSLVHLEIEEFDRKNQAALGSRLKVAGEEFEDLDEINDRYLVKVIEHMDSVRRHPKFITAATEAEAEARLRLEQQNRPGMTPYFIYHEAGSTRFVIAILPRNTMVREAISVNPEGFKFREMRFNTVGDLVDYFKRNPSAGKPKPAATGVTAASRQSSNHGSNSHSHHGSSNHSSHSGHRDRWEDSQRRY
jgi:transcription elongation factor SPT6